MYTNQIHHSRKTSLHHQVHTIQPGTQQLCYVKSLNQSPDASSILWLRSTLCGKRQRYRSDQKSVEKVRTIQEFNAGKRVEQFGMNYHVAKIRPLLKYSTLCLQSALYVVQNCIKECHAYHQRFGCSYFSITYCYVNPDNKLVINLNNPCNQAYSPISDQTRVVRDIIQSVHKICAPKVFDDFYSYYKRTSIKNKCDYKYALSLIKSYCTCAKVNVASMIRCEENYIFSQGLESSEHPGSAQKMSPVVRLTTWINRRKSTTKPYRDSIYQKVLDAQSKQKVCTFNVQEERRSNKIQIPVISIKQQYNVIVNPTNEVDMSNRKSSVKISTVSTSFKSSQHGDSLQVSSLNVQNRLLGASYKTTENKEHFSFLPKDLDQVQSLGESSDQQSLLPTRRLFETPRDDHQENIKKQNEERILTINNWTRKLNGLLQEERDLKQSITEQAKENQKERGPEKLKMLVRTVAESILPIPTSQFFIQS